jgi:hypothetical protein
MGYRNCRENFGQRLPHAEVAAYNLTARRGPDGASIERISGRHGKRFVPLVLWQFGAVLLPPGMGLLPECCSFVLP